MKKEIHIVEICTSNRFWKSNHISLLKTSIKINYDFWKFDFYLIFFDINIFHTHTIIYLSEKKSVFPYLAHIFLPTPLNSINRNEISSSQYHKITIFSPYIFPPPISLRGGGGLNDYRGCNNHLAKSMQNRSIFRTLQIFPHWFYNTPRFSAHRMPRCTQELWPYVAPPSYPSNALPPPLTKLQIDCHINVLPLLRPFSYVHGLFPILLLRKLQIDRYVSFFILLFFFSCRTLSAVCTFFDYGR